MQLVQNDRSDATDWQDCEETTAAPDPNGFDYDADDDFNLKFRNLMTSLALSEAPVVYFTDPARRSFLLFGTVKLYS